MKKLILSALSLAFLGVQAQIFINTNPNSKTNTSDTTIIRTTEVIPVELKTTSVLVETATTTTTTESNYASKANSFEAASNASEDLPPNAKQGKCYARCIVENKYNYVNETIVNTPKMINQLKLPALYKTVYDTVVISPATTMSYAVPAEYEYLKEQVMIAPATLKWIKGKADAGCLSANPADCQVMCLVEVPATYKTVEKKVLKNQAYTRQETMPLQFKIVSRELLVEAEKIIEIETPATYKTVQKRVLVEKGGYQVWREILCGNDLTVEKIIQIQRALQVKGYNPGPIDDVFGPLTKAALVQYQKDKGLPVGNLNMETLESLGVN